MMNKNRILTLSMSLAVLTGSTDVLVNEPTSSKTVMTSSTSK